MTIVKKVRVEQYVFTQDIDYCLNNEMTKNLGYGY